jgi:putative ABC transport system permease protein
VRALRIIRSSIGCLARYKLRSAFIMLGTFVGVATLTVVLSAGVAARGKLLTTVRQLFGASSIVVSSGGGFFMGGPRNSARLTLDEIEGVVQDVPGIEVWDPMQVEPDAPVRRGERSTTVRLLGQSERSEQAWGRGTTRGRFFDAADVAASARVALIGETVVRELFGEEEAIGQELQVGSVPFRVVGILQSFGTDIHGMDRDNEILVPITTAMRRVMNVDSLRGAKLVVSDPAQVEPVAREVAAALRERHGLIEGEPDDFTVITSVAVRQMVGRFERVLFVYLPLVTGISLLVAMVVAASLMLASVSERVGEVGLRGAVGARPRDISLQFLVETAVTTLTGGALGLLVGGVLGATLAQRMGLEAPVSLEVVVLGLGLSAVTGLVSGVVPARRAARLRPADVLR